MRIMAVFVSIWSTYLEIIRGRVEKYKEEKPGVIGLDFQGRPPMKRKPWAAHSVGRGYDESECCGFFLVLLPHEGLLALTKTHIHPEAPPSEMEDAKQKDAINAKWIYAIKSLCDLEAVISLLASVFSFAKWRGWTRISHFLSGSDSLWFDCL